MFSFLFKRFSGRHYRKFIEASKPIVARINELEKSYQTLTDEQLRAKTDEFRSRIAAATDKKGTIASPLNPKFDVKGLRSNGGLTQTIALQSSSPAVDKGTSLGLTGTLTTDQRGAGFLRKVDKSAANATGGDGTDIGAYELQ